MQIYDKEFAKMNGRVLNLKHSIYLLHFSVAFICDKRSLSSPDDTVKHAQIWKRYINTIITKTVISR